ncbi:MAG: ABC transporter ATP-binding protein [Proteobacteria bacterium]|nr:ABC transporter ATP-binding protein [Pseudomonadota bacterium]
MPAISTKNLTKKFDRVTAVNNLNLSIEKGEIFGFLGPNGAGKSTTIRMLCGILEPTSGEGQVGGFDINRESEQIKKIIGYMSQSFGLYQDLTVDENLKFYSRLYIPERKLAAQRIEAVVDLLLLGPYRKRLAANLSGGWRQRLALACAVVHRPQIIFLDEPTAGIDPVSRRILWDFLYELAHGGTTLFITTHYMEEAERCNQIGFIWKGDLVACDTPEGVKKSLVDEHILSLKCSDLNHAYKFLRTHELIKDVNLYGDEIHLVVANAREAIPLLRAALGSEQLSVDSLKQIQPSIEDVFVALSKKSSNG